MNIHLQNRQDAEDDIKNIISPKLLEAVVVFQKNWIFATQFEVYYRNNLCIAESAMTTMMDKYPGHLVAKIKNKTGKGKSCKMSNNFVPFLGSNVLLKELVDSESFTSEKICVNYHHDVKAHFQAKLSSSFKCVCISSLFHRKDFATIDPLNIKNGTPLTTLI
ncbi:hypothetical protein CLU79DRAFT_804993 [Phycomyces nitens]|nr:hypothetical protein CLU79DRAFT_804993 [Phycomyces nitens]